MFYIGKRFIVLKSCDYCVASVTFVFLNKTIITLSKRNVTIHLECLVLRMDMPGKQKNRRTCLFHVILECDNCSILSGSESSLLSIILDNIWKYFFSTISFYLKGNSTRSLRGSLHTIFHSRVNFFFVYRYLSPRT